MLMQIKTVQWLVLFVTLMLVAGCAGKSVTPSPTNTPEAPVSSGEYLIGPGDTLQVFVWRNPEFSVTVPVRPDGKFSTPLVEDITASGKTPSQLAREIEGRLATYIRNPTVTVIVTNFVGLSSSQVRVIGEATRPQAIPHFNGMTLLDVMISVNGLTEFASGNRASVVRGRGAGRKKIQVKLENLLKDGDINADMILEPGDILIIPRSFF